MSWLNRLKGFTRMEPWGLKNQKSSHLRTAPKTNQLVGNGIRSVITTRNAIWKSVGLFPDIDNLVYSTKYKNIALNPGPFKISYFHFNLSSLLLQLNDSIRKTTSCSLSSSATNRWSGTGLLWGPVALLLAEEKSSSSRMIESCLDLSQSGTILTPAATGLLTLHVNGVTIKTLCRSHTRTMCEEQL